MLPTRIAAQHASTIEGTNDEGLAITIARPFFLSYALSCYRPTVLRSCGPPVLPSYAHAR